MLGGTDMNFVGTIDSTPPSRNTHTHTGKPGMESAVAQLKKSGSGAGYEVQDEQRYAELWMGTHPSGPSRVLPTHEGESPVLLRDYLQVRG